jgi:hypothetical protein
MLWRVHVVELDPQLEVLLDNILNGDRRFDRHAACVLIFCDQGCRVALDGLVGKVGSKLAHQSSFICIGGAMPR